MKLGRKMTWDPEKETFANDPAANALRSRPQRPPFGVDNMRKS